MADRFASKGTRFYRLKGKANHEKNQLDDIIELSAYEKVREEFRRQIGEHTVPARFEERRSREDKISVHYVNFPLAQREISSSRLALMRSW